MLFSTSDALDSGIICMFTRLEIHPAEDRVAEEDGVKPLHIHHRSNVDIKGEGVLHRTTHIFPLV